MNGMKEKGCVGNMEAYEGLANAIVILAAKDYRRTLKKLSRNHNNLDALSEKSRLERFFRSGWFGVLTAVDPEMLIRKLQEEVEA